MLFSPLSPEKEEFNYIDLFYRHRGFSSSHAGIERALFYPVIGVSGLKRPTKANSGNKPAGDITKI